MLSPRLRHPNGETQLYSYSYRKVKETCVLCQPNKLLRSASTCQKIHWLFLISVAYKMTGQFSFTNRDPILESPWLDERSSVRVSLNLSIVDWQTFYSDHKVQQNCGRLTQNSETSTFAKYNMCNNANCIKIQA